MPANTTAAANVYQLKITLKDFRPPIWRRVLVPGHYTFNPLPCVIPIFDILIRPSPKLTRREREKVKQIARDLLDTPKAERLVLEFPIIVGATLAVALGRREACPYTGSVFSGEAICR